MAVLKKTWRARSGLLMALIEVREGVEIQMIQYFEPPEELDVEEDYDTWI